MVQMIQRSIAVLAMVVVAGVASQAADVKKALSETEGRKRAAENGLKQIKAKGTPSGQVRGAYAEASTRQNAWLDTVCQSVEQGSATAPEVAPATQAAANSLVDWVNVRNRALDLPEVTGAIADSTKKRVAQDLIDIATETWKDNRSSDAKKRTAAATALKERLRWKPFEEI
jgi:hypothetical protein